MHPKISLPICILVTHSYTREYVSLTQQHIGISSYLSVSVISGKTNDAIEMNGVHDSNDDSSSQDSDSGMFH